MLVVGSVAGSLFSWGYASNEERLSFRTAFEGYASTLIEKFLVSMENRVAVASSLSVSFTSSFKNHPWPNVTMPDFQEHSQIPLRSASKNWIAFAPIVQADQRGGWEAYAGEVVKTKKLHTGHPNVGVDGYDNRVITKDRKRTFHDGIWYRDATSGRAVDDPTDGLCVPIWQISPQQWSPAWVLFNLFDGAVCQRAMEVMIHAGAVTLSEILNDSKDDAHPTSFVFVPVYEDFIGKSVVGAITLEINWLVHFQELLYPWDKHGNVTIVVENTCNQVHTFESNDIGEMQYVGAGDLHDPKFDELRRKSDKADLIYLGGSVPFTRANLNSLDAVSKNVPNGNRRSQRKSPVSNNTAPCEYTVAIYPTTAFEGTYVSSKPIHSTFLVAGLFLFSIGLFSVYDFAVRRHLKNARLVGDGADAWINTSIHRSVSDRDIHHAAPLGNSSLTSRVDEGENPQDWRLRRMLLATSVPTGVDMMTGEPIADLFSSTTVMFADISGFSAWSSEREPYQVFQLLEALYCGFDVIAHRLGVFKVDTIGECYVAVAGLRESDTHHAVVMAQYCMECLAMMRELIKDMEVALGPGTADLGMRFGLHSGPVIAGVLRGEKSKLQVFGDTVDTALRMESSSDVNAILVSQHTANLLVACGKEDWLSESRELISIKGKGKLKAFWLGRNGEAFASESTDNDCASAASAPILKASQSMDFDDSSNASYHGEKDARLIDWTTEVLSGFLEKIVSRRLEAQRRLSAHPKPPFEDSCNILEEFTPIIALPPFDPDAAMNCGDCPYKVPNEVNFQLRVFVATIASLYRRENSFHNFEHATHVLMSATKLIKRIVSHDHIDGKHITDKCEKKRCLEAHHLSTLGISSDPLAQFAIIFSALIHDVEHPGVANVTLIDEESKLAMKYKNKSVAEQNSVVVAWSILMQEQFAELRNCIFLTSEERARFRQLVVNSVLATDIMDRDLQDLRKNRWAKAFSPEESLPTSTNEDVNRKATIVIEHIIQASDVAHTMQHWHVYTRWNERLFNEMYVAYLHGRCEKDPSKGWYEGEMGFFDFYVIPLARKLKECGVFGVSSDEYLQYALENRREWEMKGKDVSEAMVTKFFESNPDFVPLRTAWRSGAPSQE